MLDLDLAWCRPRQPFAGEFQLLFGTLAPKSLGHA
jgi:hypothetical protein